MNAFLVFDGFGQPAIPASMGQPSPDQLTGTPLENLGELASRICYDSLGNGRSSRKLHEHILEVKNHSVYEHCNFTVRFESHDPVGILFSCLNRKGVWVDYAGDESAAVYITANLRAVLEWDRHLCRANGLWTVSGPVGEVLRYFASKLAPRIVSPLRSTSDVARTLADEAMVMDEFLLADQAWVTLWLYGSRGFTHEQVRHRFAMSQRSTRYVDEDGSPYVEHPLVTKYMADESIDDYSRRVVRELIDDSMAADRITYAEIVRRLEFYGTRNGLDKLTARKQARGAARGYLGNALASEMLFSAPVSGWKWILSQRANKLADAEIRAVYEDVLLALKSSRYGDRFSDFNLVPSPDGIGKVLA